MGLVYESASLCCRLITSSPDRLFKLLFEYDLLNASFNIVFASPLFNRPLRSFVKCCLCRLYSSVSIQLWFILTLWLKWGVVGCQGSKPRHTSRTGSSSEPFYENSSWSVACISMEWDQNVCLGLHIDRKKDRCTEEKNEEWVGTAEKDERMKRRRRISFHSSIWQLTLWLALEPNHILPFTSDFSSHLLHCSHSSTTLISPLSSSFSSPVSISPLPSCL